MLRTLIQIFLDRCVQKRPNLDAAFFNNILGRKYLFVSNSHYILSSAKLEKCTLQIYSTSLSLVVHYLLIYTLNQVMMHTYATPNCRRHVVEVRRNSKKENRSIEDVGAGGTGTARAFVEVVFAKNRKK